MIPEAATEALLTPCHAVPVAAYVSDYSEEIEIYCPAEGCHATWNRNGKPE